MITVTLALALLCAANSLPAQPVTVDRATGAKRLTSMNVSEDDLEYQGAPRVACTVAISPTGDYMLGDVQDNLARQTGMVIRVTFTGS